MLTLQSVFVDDMNPRWKINESLTLHNILIFVVQGKLSYHLDGIHVPLEKDDVLYIPKGTLRSGTNDSSGPHLKYAAFFDLEDPSAFPLAEPHLSRKLSVRNADYLKQRFVILRQQWTNQLHAYETICQGIVTELIGWFAQECEAERYSAVKLSLIRQIQSYLKEHYRKAVKIGELSELVDRTPNHITQTFKEVTGITPITYLHQLRIQAARDLMLNTRMTIGEVSDYLGYSDQAHFNRMFKKIMGYAPSRLLR